MPARTLSPTYHSAEAAVELRKLDGEGGEEDAKREHEGADDGRQPRGLRLAFGRNEERKVGSKLSSLVSKI